MIKSLATSPINDLCLCGEFTCNMAMTCSLSQTLHYKPSNALKIRLSSKIDETKLNITRIQAMKRCLRCNTLYLLFILTKITPQLPALSMATPRVCAPPHLNEFPVSLSLFLMGVLCLQCFV